MIAIGCDIGSLFTKAVVLDGDDLVASQITRTTGTIAEEIGEFIKGITQKAGVKSGYALVGTGNGADLLRGADFTEDVITCLSAATCFFLPEVRLSIDLGGQSITSILLDGEGDVINFMRNDKCASGSGRFLEVMSDKLMVGITDIDKTVTASTRAVDLSTQCGVFAESEVITLINGGESVPNIITGVCASVADMAAAQARKFRDAGCFTITGGVARIQAVVERITQKLDGTYKAFPHKPQFAAAIGAALLGQS